LSLLSIEERFLERVPTNINTFNPTFWNRFNELFIRDFIDNLRDFLGLSGIFLGSQF